jgi:hypothetical protein
VKESELSEIKKAWKNEVDAYLLEAYNEDLNDYPVEVQEIIKNEVSRRGLEGAHYEVPNVSKEIASDTKKIASGVSRLDDILALLEGYTAKYSFFSKMFFPAIIFFYSYCGALGVLIAFGLRKLLYKEIEVEEDIIFSKKKK